MNESRMLSIDQCKRILEAEGGSYSDEQVEMIRNTLYKLAELDYLIFIESISIIKIDTSPDSISEHKKAA